MCHFSTPVMFINCSYQTVLFVIFALLTPPSRTFNTTLPSNTDRNSSKEVQFSWKILDDFEVCNCISALKRLIVACFQQTLVTEEEEQRVEEEERVSEEKCRRKVKPVVFGVPCPEDCPSSWVILTDFTPCSATCGGGTQRRLVKCGNPNHLYYDAPNIISCYSSMTPKPVTEKSCANVDCKPQYIVSSWSKECYALSESTHCGIGYNVRSLGCEQKLANGVTVQQDSCDIQQKPNLFRDCYKPCPGLSSLEEEHNFEHTFIINATGKYFVHTNQHLFITCTLKCGIDKKFSVSPRCDIRWRFNGEDLNANYVNKLNKTSLSIDRFDKERHMGQYKCFIHTNVKSASEKSECSCNDTMEISLIHVTDKPKLTTSSPSPVSVLVTHSSVTSSTSYLQNSTTRGFKWLTTEWSNDCKQNGSDEKSNIVGHNSARDSKTVTEVPSTTKPACFGSQGRFVWCGVPDKDKNKVTEENSSQCDPTTRPESVRKCFC